MINVLIEGESLCVKSMLNNITKYEKLKSFFNTKYSYENVFESYKWFENI